MDGGSDGGGGGDDDRKRGRVDKGDDGCGSDVMESMVT